MEKEHVKKYLIGGIISIVLFVVLLIISAQIYNNTMPLIAPISFLTLHVLAFKYLIPEKRYAAYFFIVFMFGAAVFFSLPEYTHQQAQEKVLASYDMELTELGNLPLEDSGNPFASRWAYAFEGVEPTDKTRIWLLFIPHSGKVFEIEPSEIP